MKKFIKHPATITIGSLLIIGGILSLIGYNYWGWFGGSDSWKVEQINSENNSAQRTKSDCCKNADGNSCYPCVSIACCGAGFRAGHIENRDIMERNKSKV